MPFVCLWTQDLTIFLTNNFNKFKQTAVTVGLLKWQSLILNSKFSLIAAAL